MSEVKSTPLTDLELAEAELQRELRSMFELDTQTYLQSYLQLIQTLSTVRWTDDIQELYRCIHTIKGGAVTVNANPVLQATSRLEDLLSDLRYLQIAPPLEDGQLSKLLGIAGELVTSSMLIADQVEAESPELASILESIDSLRQQVQDRYLKEVDEHLQLSQDFAKQGFDLVVLDLEMGLEAQPETGMVTSEMVNAAAQVFANLASIGTDLALGEIWSQIIEHLYQLLLESEISIWRSQIQTYLPLLKQCALMGGELPEEQKSLLSIIPRSSDEGDHSLGDLLEDLQEDLQDCLWDIEPQTAIAHHLSSAEQQFSELCPAQIDGSEEKLSEDKLSEDKLSEDKLSEDINLDWITLLDLPPQGIAKPQASVEIAAVESATQVVDPLAMLSEIVESRQIPEDLTEDIAFPTLDTPQDPQQISDASKSDASNVVEAQDDFEDRFKWSIEPEAIVAPHPAEALALNASSVQGNKTVVTQDVPKIPVPLDRLERSAQSLVDMRLAVRSTQGQYDRLQTQLIQMVELAQESFTYISRLREMQDDYALMQNLESHPEGLEGPQLERYRTGYTVINRLLENSLRLSEIGAEATSISQYTAQEFDNLNVHLQSLQHTLDSSRLLPFKTVTFRLRAVLRDLINRMGKPAHLEVEGETQDLDAGTIQSLEPALLHLIRNAYDHGLESLEQRQQAQKTPEGTITLSLKRQGNHYRLRFQDDGQGIDPDHIQRIAQEKQLPLTQTHTPAKLLAVLCQSGFSSQSTVSDVSGRGVGMDVVMHQIQSLGGQLTLETRLGKGTTFDFKIPVPQMLVPCMVVKVGGESFAIPTDVIQTMRLWNDDDISEGAQNPFALWTISYQGQQEPVVPFQAYWRGQSAPAQPQKTSVCLRIQGADDQKISGGSSQALWILVDDLEAEMDLLINPIPSPIIPPKGLMGMSLLPSGQMIPVVEANVVATTILAPTNDFSLEAEASQDQFLTPLFDASGSTSNLILVVDDAALLRRRLEVSLVNYGYEVQTCRDGLEAWKWLQANPKPVLMITDIEMPQMDGFTLVNHCRQADMTFPILVSSSRLSEEWQKEARRVGANEYLTKGFSTAELIQQVTALIEGAKALAEVGH